MFPQMQEHDLAKETVEFFLSRKPTVDHFYCRALLCLAVLQKNSIRGLKGTVCALLFPPLRAQYHSVRMGGGRVFFC